MPVNSYKQPTVGRTLTLRFDHDLPATAAYTIERVVEGDPSRVIVYVPWVHDVPHDPSMPEPYLASLVEVLVSLSSTVRVIGFEGDLAEISLRTEDELLHAFLLAQCLAPGTFTSDDTECTDNDVYVEFVEEIAKWAEEIAKDEAPRMIGGKWISYAVAQRTIVDIIGIESIPLLWDMKSVDGCNERCASMSWSCGTPSELTTVFENLARTYVGDTFGDCDITVACCAAAPLHSLGVRTFAALEFSRRVEAKLDRHCIARVNGAWSIMAPERSDDAVRNTLQALDARGGGRAILIFGMGHHHDIEVATRRAGATLDLVCIPHLCRAAAP